jgi:hypothetical protein
LIQENVAGWLQAGIIEQSITVQLTDLLLLATKSG